MIKSEDQQNSNTQMKDLFEDGMEQFVDYKRDDTGKKTRGQKKRQKEERMLRDLNDPQKKKQRSQVRRLQYKNKLKKQIDGLNEEQTKKFLVQKKLKKKLQKKKLRDAVQSGIPILIDIVYEKIMNNKENKSLAIQIQLIMKAMKHLEHPPSVHLCSVGGYAKTQLEKMRYNFWTMTSSPDDVIQVSNKLGKKPVYLSPDATEPLMEIDPEAAYIIGGLVDRTVVKNASLIRARALQIPAYHLPIKQMMRNRSCLNLDHVVKIMCKFKQVNDWNEAFEFGAPKRWKKTALKDQENSQKQEQSQEQGENDKLEQEENLKQKSEQ